MTLKLNHKNNTDCESEKAIVNAYWKFNEGEGELANDSSNHRNTLKATGNPLWINEERFAGISLKGDTQWLGNDRPVLKTDESYSVVAWVRLDSDSLNGKLELKAGEHALTAISQDSPTHSAFYLGVRQIEETKPDGNKSVSLRWNFTVSPIDGSETGALEWVHAHSSTALSDAVLNKWFMLIGVHDAENKAAHIYIPELKDKGIAHFPEGWTFWKSNGGLQIGRGLWLGRNVDQWPGSVGPVIVFAGKLSEEDAKELYSKGPIDGALKIGE
jgi:hypothetical protein